MQNLTQQLHILIDDIQRLTALTYQDIELVKSAKHAQITQNHHEKNRLIDRFESNKSVLNDILQQLTVQNPSKALHEIISQEESLLLDQFKAKLLELHEANKIYAKFVVSLHEFYNSLVSAILPMKEEGYRTGQPKPAAFLQVSA